MKRLFIQDEKNGIGNRTGSLIHTAEMFSGVKKNAVTGDFFHLILTNADGKSGEVFKQIKDFHEIYFDSAMIPTNGHGNNIASALWMNNFMQYVADKKIKGKDIFLFMENKSISWSWFHTDKLNKCFDKNSLYIMDSVKLKWDKVDVDDLMRTTKAQIEEKVTYAPDDDAEITDVEVVTIKMGSPIGKSKSKTVKKTKR